MRKIENRLKNITASLDSKTLPTNKQKKRGKFFSDYNFFLKEINCHNLP